VTEANNGPTIAMTYNAMGLRAGYTVTPYGAGQPSLNEQFTYRGGQLAQTVTISGTTSYTDTYTARPLPGTPPLAAPTEHRPASSRAIVRPAKVNRDILVALALERQGRPCSSG